MAIDENDFFRQATLRICSSLDMETAMQRSLQYLSEVMPVDHLILGLYDRGLGAMRTISMVSLHVQREEYPLIPLSADVRKMLENPGSLNQVFIDRPDLDSVMVRIINDPTHDPVAGPIFSTLGAIDSSLLLMRLDVEGAILGNLALRVAGTGKYTEEHARLLALLREPFAIALSNTLKHQEVLKLKDLLTDDNKYLHRELFHLSGEDIVGADRGLREVMDMVRHVAPLDSHVLLRGETGVGKDVIAHAIHDSSPRREGPLIRVNCGAIAESLIDSELFGHEKGAFTGATAQKRGCFELANRGTIFLDEIGELPLAAQVRMLRVLQYREIQRVGGAAPVPTDIRVIAATHRDLEEMVKAGRFREDLWFRLNVFPIVIPPLRKRKADIPAFVDHFIRRKSMALKLPTTPALAPRAIDRLIAYDWPGNVRELENVLERALILSKGGQVTFDPFLGSRPEGSAARADETEMPLPLEEAVSSHIRRVLEQTGGKVHGAGGAAELLRINPSTLRSKMSKLGIPYGREKKAKYG
jgi:transcriptional regulator with GAF, ATPase, and Fis domain